jgi:hypothetical protein
LLTHPDTGVIAPQLQLIVDALAEMDRPNSGLTWIRQAHVRRVLRELAAPPPPPPHGLDQFQSWVITAQQRITTDKTESSSPGSSAGAWRSGSGP